MEEKLQMLEDILSFNDKNGLDGIHAADQIQEERH